MNVLEVSALHAGYRDRPVIREVAFSVGQGELWAILGPNGAGKSTLLRTCLGLLSKQAGRISILGKSIEEWSRRELAQRMAWVPQSFDSGAGFTGLELVLMGRSPHLGLWGLPSRADLDHALALMQDLQIEQLASRASDALSGGERRLLLPRLAARRHRPVDEHDARARAANRRVQLQRGCRFGRDYGGGQPKSGRVVPSPSGCV